MSKKCEQDTSCTLDDGCPTELAVLQRFWRNTANNIAAQKMAVKAMGRDSDWWRGYAAALHWISVEAFTANVEDHGPSSGKD